jgi:pilus assembly protein TadC
MSAVVRIAVGIVSFFGFALAAVLFLYAANPWMERAEIPVLGSRIYDTAIFGVTGLLCIFVSIRLIQGKNWAWWTAIAVSIAALGLGVLFFVSALHPRDDFARSEAGFGLGISLILVTPGAISGVLLSLAPVRRRFVVWDAKRPTV